MSNFKVGCSPLTGDIFAGSISKTGLWGKKHEVTETAVGAVAQHLLHKNQTVKFRYKDERYVLKVVKIKEDEQ